MNKLATFVLIIAAGSANAEIFKCQLVDKTVYQSQPCDQTAVNQRILKIEPLPPEKTLEAEQRLNTWETEFAAREAAERQAQKEKAAALAKQAEIDALRRSAEAQEELARRPLIINQQPVFIGYPRRFRRFEPVEPGNGRHHELMDKPQDHTQTNDKKLSTIGK